MMFLFCNKEIPAFYLMFSVFSCISAAVPDLISIFFIILNFCINPERTLTNVKSELYNKLVIVSSLDGQMCGKMDKLTKESDSFGEICSKANNAGDCDGIYYLRDYLFRDERHPGRTL